MSPRRSDNLESYGENYGTPQRVLGDLEPRLRAVEQRLENVASNHERTLEWVEDLSTDFKAMNGKLDKLTEELSKLRENFARHMGLWTGGAIVVSMIISKLM
jgi:predicted nuclease with TOPRIM domain